MITSRCPSRSPHWRSASLFEVYCPDLEYGLTKRTMPICLANMNSHRWLILLGGRLGGWKHIPGPERGLPSRCIGPQVKNLHGPSVHGKRLRRRHVSQRNTPESFSSAMLEDNCAPTLNRGFQLSKLIDKCFHINLNQRSFYGTALLRSLPSSVSVVFGLFAQPG
jgi:hypothetical protein